MYASIPLSSTADTNKVLRNAFALLAISMLPTIGGAWIGTVIGVPALMATSPLLSSLLFIAVMFGVLFGINALRNSGAAVLLMLGFTGLIGMWLSGLLSAVLSMSNGSELVSMAGLGTAAVVAGCSIFAMNTKRDFSGIGGFLFGSVIALIVIGLTNIFFQLPLLSITLSIAAVIIFSAFMVFDVQRVVNGGETNYVLAATSIYLNIYNIFSSILQLLSIFSSDD
jgi:modulator of FtsH protease